MKKKLFLVMGWLVMVVMLLAIAGCTQPSPEGTGSTGKSDKTGNSVNENKPVDAADTVKSDKTANSVNENKPVDDADTATGQNSLFAQGKMTLEDFQTAFNKSDKFNKIERWIPFETNSPLKIAITTDGDADGYFSPLAQLPSNHLSQMLIIEETNGMVSQMILVSTRPLKYKDPNNLGIEVNRIKLIGIATGYGNSIPSSGMFIQLEGEWDKGITEVEDPGLKIKFSQNVTTDDENEYSVFRVKNTLSPSY